MRKELVFVLAVAVVAAGCRNRKKAQERREKDASEIVSRAVSLASGQETKVEVAGDTVTFHGEEGEVKIQGGKDAKLPDGFPDDVPVYEGASVIQSASRGSDAFSVMLETDDGHRKIAAFYKDKMKAKGWSSETTMDMPEQSMLAFRKGDRSLTLMVMKGEGKTVITMASGPHR